MTSLTEARQKAQDGTTYIDETRDSIRTVSDVRDAEALGDLFDDECARTILVKAKKEPCSAAELSDCAGVSEPTVYRRLERLREYDLITEDIQPVTDGKNYKLYWTELDSIELDLSEDGFEITVSRRDRMVDRFTQFVEGS